MTENHPRNPDGTEIALEPREGESAKLTSPSAGRNKDVILDAFKRLMPQKGIILELASGTGQHGAHIVAALPDITWLPSDPDEGSRASIEAYGEDFEDGRLRLPFNINVQDYGWWDTPDIDNIDGIVCINLLHISPYEVTEGLFRGAAALLQAGERMFLYGPFSRKGEMAESNRAFDADLKRRDPEWGVKDLDEQIIPLASHHALHLVTAEDVAANNMVVVFEKG